MADTIDTLHRVETPENIALQAESAGLISRVLAFLVDLGIRTFVMAALGLASLFMDGMGQGVFLLGWFLLNWLYPVFFEVLGNGSTPGKKALGIRVVHLDLSPVGWNASLTRNLLRTVDFLPTGYVLGVFTMCMNDRFQRLGDLAAGTLVVYAGTSEQEGELPDVRPTSTPLALDIDEQQVLTAFARRSALLSESRRAELASILEPLTPKSAQHPVAYWQGVGVSLVGRK